MLGLRTTIYKVNDLQQAVVWYSKVFERAPYFNTPAYVDFSIKGHELVLLPENNTTEKVDNILSYWAVEKMQDSYECLLKLDRRTHQFPKHVGGGIMPASVLDPWNNVLGSIYNPTFKVL